MIIFVCVDNRSGMLFNSRRQSSDRYVITDIVKEVGGADLYLSPYSKSLFSNQELSLKVSEDFLGQAGAGDYCFVEKNNILPYKDSLESLIIYRWNRDYPGDFYLDLNPEKFSSKSHTSIDFKGYSHDIITKEVFLF